MTMEAVSKLIEERDHWREQFQRIEAQFKAHEEKPARFRRITKRTEITVPCLLARLDGECWYASIFTEPEYVETCRDHYTHWLPFQWPGVRG